MSETPIIDEILKLLRPCIKKSCHVKDKEGKPLEPVLIRTFITKAHGQFRDAEQLHCGGCGEKWTQFTTVRTKKEYKAWKEKEAAAIAKVMEKINEQNRSNKAAEAAAPSLTNNAI